MKVIPIHCDPMANESERKAFERLKSCLISAAGDDEWLLLTNLMLSTNHRFQSDEIDIVAIGPPGVRIIEVKHWSAAWMRGHPDDVKHAADLIGKKARRVGTTLRRKSPNLGRVDGVFLLTEETVKVQAVRNKIFNGVSCHSLQDWRAAIGLDGSAVLTDRQVHDLAKSLYPKVRVAVDGHLRRFAGYTNLELQTPADQRFHRVYKGVRPSSRDPIILHLYDLSASLPDPQQPGDRQAGQTYAETRARREFETLHRLQRYGWAPRLLDSWQEAPGYPGEMGFFTVVDPAAPTLDERVADDAWSTEVRLSFSHRAVQVLQEMHGAGADGAPMMHRNLSPQTILVQYDNSPILTGFELSKIPADATVAVFSSKLACEGNDVLAPEVRTQGLAAADQRSDLYALCASLIGLFEERHDDLGAQAVEVLNRGLEDDPAQRIELGCLEADLAELLGKPPLLSTPPARYWTEGQVVAFRDQRYRIVSRLGTGGVGITFKVVKLDRVSKEELGTYVAKIVRDEEKGQRVLKSYNLAHSHLRHAALSTIFEVAPQWQENNFIALMTWIEGGPLSDYAGVLPLLAEDVRDTSGESLALRWLQQTCKALDVLHRNGLVHGDVSPRNLIVSRDGDIVLTDYDCVGKINEPACAPGTPLYVPPRGSEDHPTAPSDDLYALAASFFYVLFEMEPFQYDGLTCKERGLNWEGLEETRDDYPTIAAFLDQATRPDPAQRFPTVAVALAALEQPFVSAAAAESTASTGDSIEEHAAETPAGAAVEPPNAGPRRAPEHRERSEVPWLKSLLQSYPGSRWGNAETRGLDSDFAAKTYVETALERALRQDIKERRKRLIILCGNAGDGKTALLQHLAQSLGLGRHNSSARILKGRMEDGVTVRMNLDGSASWKGRSADDWLDEFLAPFQHGAPNDDIVHLLAINDGRLLEWLEYVEDSHGQATPLTEALVSMLNQEDSTPASHIRFISLNQRSLVGRVTSDTTEVETDFLSDLLKSLYGGECTTDIWQPCRT